MQQAQYLIIIDALCYIETVRIFFLCVFDVWGKSKKKSFMDPVINNV